MKELGRILREERERLGLSLNDLEVKTKIRKRYLEAIEQGDWSHTPGDVYARGFVRSYAEALGLNGRQLLEQYTEHTGGASPHQGPSKRDEEPIQAATMPLKSTNPTSSRSATPVAKREPQRTTRHPRKKGRNVAAESAAVVAILAVIGVGWWVVSGVGGKTHGALRNTSSVQNTTAVQNLTNSTAVSSTGTSGNTAANNTASTNNSAGNNTSNASSSGTPAIQLVSQTFQGNEQTYVVSTSNPLQVTLTTSDTCWIEVVADGAIVDASDTLAANANKSWTANQSVRIKVGNVPAVQLTVNGQTMTLPTVNNPIWVTIKKS